MTIETEIKSLVSIYASYDEDNKSYNAKLNKEALFRLDADFIRLLNKLLLKDGPDKKKIQKNYRSLSLYFHPDLLQSRSEEVKWLEGILSENHNNGACFKSLSLCYEKLTSPQEFKPIQFEEISSRDDLKKWLENLIINSRTFTERNFYASLLGLLHESTAYFDEVGRIKPKGIKALISFIPLVFISFGTFVFAEELFAVYALYFVLLKGGQYTEKSSSQELQSLGMMLQKISVITAMATTTVLARLIEMTFWASRQCYVTTLQIGTALLTPLIASYPEAKIQSSPTESSLCMDLILASQNHTPNANFKTIQLNMIAAPIESCLGLLDQQFFKNWRLGGDKYRALQSFLLRMRVFDKDDQLGVEEKINKVYEALQLIKKNSDIYTKGGNTASSIDRAERVIYLIKEGMVVEGALPIKKI